MKEQQFVEKIFAMEGKSQKEVQAVVKQELAQYGIGRNCSIELVEVLEALAKVYTEILALHTFKFVTPVEVEQREVEEDAQMHTNMFAKENSLVDYQVIHVANIQEDAESKVFLTVIVEMK